LVAWVSPASQSLPAASAAAIASSMEAAASLARPARAAAWLITRSAVGTGKSSPLARLSSRLSVAQRSSVS
jgi:hypothetical protein